MVGDVAFWHGVEGLGEPFADRRDLVGRERDGDHREHVALADGVLGGKEIAQARERAAGLGRREVDDGDADLGMHQDEAGKRPVRAADLAVGQQRPVVGKARQGGFEARGRGVHGGRQVLWAESGPCRVNNRGGGSSNRKLRQERGSQPARGSEQAQALEARVAAAADDDVIVNLHTHRGERLGDGAGHFDVVSGRCRVARGMVVDQYTRRELSIIFQHVAKITKSTGVVNWYMWCVTGCDK